MHITIVRILFVKQILKPCKISSPLLKYCSTLHCPLTKKRHEQIYQFVFVKTKRREIVQEV